jgi:hypothetical protein
MKMIKATTDKDIALDSVVVTLQQVDGKVEAIVITDKNGKFIRIVKDGQYTEHLKILIEEPVEYTTVYKLTVKIDDGVSVYNLDSKEKLDRKIASLYIQEGDYTVEEVQVEVKKDLSGRVVDDLDALF